MGQLTSLRKVASATCLMLMMTQLAWDLGTTPTVVAAIAPTAPDRVTLAYQHLAQRMDVYFSDNRPRLIESYMIPYPPGPPGANPLAKVAFIYDNAMAVTVFVARGTSDDLRRAKLICDALLWYQNNDPVHDGRLRKAYRSDQDLTTATSPWVPANDFWISRTGELAWVGLAWLTYYSRDPNVAYLDAAKRIANFVGTRLRDPSGYGFYRGSEYLDNPNNKSKSTEHNLDLYVFFMRLYDLTGNATWNQYATEAKRFVERVAWDGVGGKFWAGTKWNPGTNVVTLNQTNLPEDQQAWALLALGRVSTYGRVLDWVYNTLRITSDGFQGFDYGINVDPLDPWYSPTPDGVWFEGTAHIASAYQVSRTYGGPDYSPLYLGELDRAQQSAQNTNGKGIVAASHDGVTTGFPWFSYYASPHIGATAWYIAAKRHYNPFWNTSTDAPVPHQPTPSTCFLAGTPVLLADGSLKPIETVRVGDAVMAFDEKTKTLKRDRVKKRFEHQASHYLVVNEHIKVTPEHRVYANGNWVAVRDLKVGNMLLTAQGTLEPIRAIQEIHEPVKVYNLEVNPYHTYVAGGVVVHNAKAPPRATQ